MAVRQQSGSQLHFQPFLGLMLVFLQMPGVFGGWEHSLVVPWRGETTASRGWEIEGLKALAVVVVLTLLGAGWEGS